MNMKKAFTMAEAILVMTILGIIATIMITTLKPAEYKDKGMKILAKKVLSEVDTATTQILINNSMNGTMKKLYVPGSSNTFAYKGNANNVGKLYKKYLTATRQKTTGNDCNITDFTNSFFLKDGACIGFKVGNASDVKTIFPGETNVANSTVTQGFILFDINGAEEPNANGKDRFILPVGDEGIMYAD